MCEIRVSKHSLKALAVTLGVMGWAHVAYASQGGFIQLPQALVQDRPQMSAHVPVADSASGAQLSGEFDAAAHAILAATHAQCASGTFPRDTIVLALVPGQNGARSSDLMTTGSGAFGIVAEEAAAAGAYGDAFGTGETRAFADPAAAAPFIPGSDSSRSDTMIIAAGSSGTTDAAKPSEGKEADSDDSDDGTETPTDKKPDFTGSAVQAEPDLESTEEKDLILKGWK